MKKIIITIAVFIVGICQAQVAIGKSTVNGSGILDFASSSTKGILLPIVETLPTGAAATNGTILMDKNDLKLKLRENGAWVDLSDAGSISGITFNTSSDAGIGVIMGANTSSAEGVLVLEATDKALILPQVANPHTTVKSPRAGMMCYDTASDTLAIFDGLKWNYWK
jgi:hypothetical protein